jgi:hypothetical protein
VLVGSVLGGDEDPNTLVHWGGRAACECLVARLWSLSVLVGSVPGGYGDPTTLLRWGGRAGGRAFRRAGGRAGCVGDEPAGWRPLVCLWAACWVAMRIPPRCCAGEGVRAGGWRVLATPLQALSAPAGSAAALACAACACRRLRAVQHTRHTNEKGPWRSLA